MSLVDYASSDDDVSEAEEEEHKEEPKHQPSSPSLPYNNSTGLSSNQQQESAVQSSAPSIEKLPDASFLLNSPTISLASGGDHASRVAAAMAESASRKIPMDRLPLYLAVKFQGGPCPIRGMFQILLVGY